MRAAALAIFLFASTANATGFTDVGEDLHARPKSEVKVDGYFRLRGEWLNNLDLDRGLTPSGEALFPVPEGNPTGQSLTYGDMRLRTDVAVYTAGGAVAIKARIDTFDNSALGGSAKGVPSASTTQLGIDAIRVKRAYGEVLLPFGVLAAGRMGAHYGMGMVANGGDCADCDSGDAQDRVALISPLLGHIFAAAYDLAWAGPTAGRRDAVRRIGIAPSAQVHGLTFALLRWNDDLAHVRRRNAGKTTVNYGATISHRWQSSDAPYEYLPIAQGARPSTTITARGMTATVLDAWFRLIFPHGRIELEAAMVLARVEQPSLIPGVISNQAATSKQYGAALQTEIGAPQDIAGGGVDAGYASGDSAPGFGALQGSDPLRPAPRPGDLDGPQANLPYDRTVDNFRFNPDYRIDRILFREIIGTVTDAMYVRPHARVTAMKLRTGTMQASVAAIASWAVYASSTPGGKTPLGLEIDPTLSYLSNDGFGVALEGAVFFPGNAFNNPEAKLTARPAQLLRVRLMFLF